MQNEAGDSFFLERALFLAENLISRSSMHQNLFCLAGKLDLDERKLLMVRKHILFSTMRLPQLAAGRVSVLLKNRALFSGGVWWSHVTYQREIFPLKVFTTQNGLRNALSDWKNVLWSGSYCIAKFEKFQKMDVRELEGWCGGGAPPNHRLHAYNCLGEHHHILFQRHMQRKDESFNGCRFCAPAKCTPPQSAQNVTVGGGVTWMCRSVNSSIQPIQTWYYGTSIMLIVREKREQLFIVYLLKSNKK